jgi:hypothetical protein
MNNKGVQSQFTWIFIMVAGAIILTLFITVSYRQQAVSTERLAVNLERTLDTIIATSLQTPESTFPVPTPLGGVTFGCTKTCDCRLGVGPNPRGSPFRDKIYFAPPFVEGGELLLWTTSWETPFRATNFLYITTPSVDHIIVVDDSPRSQKLREILEPKIPSNISARFVQSRDVNNIEPRLGETRVLFLSSGKAALPTTFAQRVIKGIAVNVQGDKVQFLTKGEGEQAWSLGSTSSIPTDDVAFILASYLSADSNMFNCGIQHAYTRLAFISNITMQKALLMDGYEDCFYLADAGEQQLSDLSDIGNKLSTDPQNDQLLTQLSRIRDATSTLNNNKIQSGCPSLY